MRRTSLTGGVRAKTGSEQERGTRGKQDEGSAAPKYRRPRTAKDQERLGCITAEREPKRRQATSLGFATPGCQ